jgi:RNA polymerase sigma-70 factor (ECF subfamily)
MALYSDEEILEGIRAQTNDYAVTKFVRKYQNFVYSIALRYLQSERDAEDASQEIFIKALASISKFRGESSLKTWLYRISKNYCLNQIRKKKALTFFGLFGKDEDGFDFDFVDPDLTPDEKIEKSETETRFLKALSKLPEKQRETFALRYFEDMKYEEISQVLGITVGGLKANYYHAVKKLAVELQDLKD